MKKLLTLCLLLALVPAWAQQAGKQPKLVVAVVIEHARYDYLQRFQHKFTERGFRRLMREGVQCQNATYEHNFNHDAVGYSTLVTGAEPAAHGIIGNSWFDRNKKKQVYCVEDAQARTLGAQNDLGNLAPTKLMASTIGDAIKLSTMGKSKVIGVAMKDLGAILGAGRTANGAYWLDRSTGAWVSSNYYHDLLPGWVTSFNQRGSSDSYLNKHWEPEYKLEYYDESLPDVNTFETGYLGYKNAFPYFFDDLRKRTGDYSLLMASPFGNTLTRDFAISAIINENLGADKFTDFLLVGFSASGYLSQYFTPNSVETQDLFLKLDKDIAYLLDFLDQQVGKGEYLLVLTSNTGAMYSQGYLASVRMDRGMFNHRVALPLARSYLKAVYGPKAEWITHYEELQFYFDHDAILKAGQNIGHVQHHLAEFLMGFDGVAAAYSGHSLQTTAFAQGAGLKMQNAYNPKRSADVLLALQPGWVQQDQSADHNSAYLYDTHVPLIWFGNGLQAKELTQRVSMADVAVTLANRLRIPVPESASGQVIVLE